MKKQGIGNCTLFLIILISAITCITILIVIRSLLLLIVDYLYHLINKLINYIM